MQITTNYYDRQTQLIELQCKHIIQINLHLLLVKHPTQPIAFQSKHFILYYMFALEPNWLSDGQDSWWLFV